MNQIKLRKILTRIFFVVKMFTNMSSIRYSLASRGAVVEMNFRGRGKVGPTIRLRKGTTDLVVCKKIFLDLEYNLNFPNSLTSIIDGGANIGAASIYLAEKFPHAKILAVEPDPENLILLKLNVASYPNIKIYGNALWGVRKTVRLGRSVGFDSSAVTTSNALGTAYEVETVTIDYLLDENNFAKLNFLKLDIEGAERELFADCQTWIDRVEAIAVEVHDFLDPMCRQSVEDATNHFSVRDERGETLFITKEANSG